MKPQRLMAEAVARTIRAGSPAMVAPIPAASDPSMAVFADIMGNPALAAAILAKAKQTKPATTRGAHLDPPLFSQWPIHEADGWVARVHCFHRDDPDRPHNHAWPWRSLVLEGGYWDVAQDGVRTWRAPGDLMIEDGSRFHTIELQDGVEAWTFFMHGPAVREWGFLNEFGGVTSREQYVSVAGS